MVALARAEGRALAAAGTGGDRDMPLTTQTDVGRRVSQVCQIQATIP
jgi:hypothetical protein